MKNYDVVIIGGGAVGCACARSLSQYDLKVALVEKECDVACGTSGRNSAVVHAGFNNKPGTLMAKFCVEGNKNFEQLCRELDVPYQKTGKYLVAFDEEDKQILEGLIRKGKENGCGKLSLIDGDEVRKKEPYIRGKWAMYSESTAIFNPFLYTVALAENAHENGVDFYFNYELVSVQKIADEFVLYFSGKDEIKAKYVINSAGLYSADIAELFGISDYKIYPCRGEYFILDKEASKYLKTPVYPAPKPGIGGLGVHLTPTSDGNIIIGPSAEYIDDKDDTSTTKEIMDKLFLEAKQLLPELERRHIIGSYAGLRAKQAPKSEGGFRDFVIKEEENCEGLINLIGIESPGLTASVPIAQYVVSILQKKITLQRKEHYNPYRKGAVRFRELTLEEQQKMVKEDPEYGEIVCRCESITKKEIKNAIENSLGVKSVSSIKNRTRAMTGRCQGGYCLSKIAQILIDEYGIQPEEIEFRGKGTELFKGKVK